MPNLPWILRDGNASLVFVEHGLGVWGGRRCAPVVGEAREGCSLDLAEHTEYIPYIP
jgi:hypothetical protein